MTYRIEQCVSKISSPVIVAFDGKETQFSDGKELADAVFEKPVIIRSVSVKKDKILINLSENDTVNETNWLGEEQAEFF